jgi:hypothetical protein
VRILAAALPVRSSVYREQVGYHQPGEFPFADECRRRALVFMQIAREAPDFAAQALFVAEQWLTLGGLEEIVHGRRPSDSQSFH